MPDTSPPPSPLAVRLAALYTDLALAGTEAEILAAVARTFAADGLDELRLVHLNCDERGRPREAEVVARWPPTDPPHVVQRLPAAQLPFAHLWLRAPGEPSWSPDLAADPLVDHARLAPVRALAVLPLRDERLATWQGALLLGWNAPHTPTPEQQFLARAVIPAVTAAVGARRTLQAHADALAETGTLYSASAELNQATSVLQLLGVVAATARAYGASHAWLMTVDEEDAATRPTWLTLQAVWPPETAPIAVPVRFAATHLPLVDLWLRDGLVPVFTADIAEDRRIDPATQKAAAALGIRGAVALPLAWRGRWTAIVTLGWPTPHHARPGEQRMFTAIARQAAVALDNRLLLAQAQRILAEHRQEHATVATLLDNLPVGVFVNDPVTSEPLLLNRAGQELVRDLAFVALPGTDTPIDPQDHSTARAARTRAPASQEADLVRKDGTRRTIASTSTPLLGDHGQPVRIVSVFQDITARRDADRERARLHDDLIRLQSAALAERGAPLIPVTDEILVMPIVGAVDQDRGHQILETLVGLGGRTRVRVAILDLTGVRDLDAPAADAIVGAAKALRLRGARPILTGFHAAAAAALTTLGVDLQGFEVCATLQQAVALATALTRKPTPPT